MPGLRGNWCWGNRGSFSIYGEPLESGIDRDVTVNPPTAFVSTNTYYGHQRLLRFPQTTQESTKSDDVGCVQHDSSTDMDVGGDLVTDLPVIRKRPLTTEQDFQNYKRIRQGSSKFIEEEVQFMENYNKSDSRL